MSRLIRHYKINRSPDAVFGDVYKYLTQSGFQYVEMNGQNVFTAGNGVTSNQVFFKFWANEEVFRMETWMLEAGTYATREIDYEGPYAAVPKAAWRRHVGNLECLITGTAPVQERAPKWMIAVRTLLLIFGIVIATYASFLSMYSSSENSRITFNKAPFVFLIIAVFGGVLIVASDVMTKMIRKRMEKPILFGFLTPAQFALLITFLIFVLYILLRYVFDLQSNVLFILPVLTFIGVNATVVLAIVRRKIVNRIRAQKKQTY